MAIKMNHEEIKVFKNNLQQMLPYQDKDLINLIAKGLYSSSSFSWEILNGLEQTIAINNIQLYSRHNVHQECQQLCSHIALPKLQIEKKSTAVLEQIEEEIRPNLKKLRKEQKKQFQELCESNEKLLAEDPSKFEVNVYGVAAGHVVEYLHEQYPNLKVNVYILNFEITAIMLALDPKMGQRFANENTKLFSGDYHTKIADNAIVINSELALKPESNAELKQRLRIYIEQNYVNLLNRKRCHNLNILISLYTLPYCKIAPQLKVDTLGQCDEIALLFPGFSLSENLNNIKSLSDSGVKTIACDISLIYLEQKDFAPDIVVAPDLGIYKICGKNSTISDLTLVKKNFYKNSILLITSKTHLRIPAYFNGPHYLIYTEDLKRKNIEQQEGALTGLDISNSSSSLIFSIALTMKPKKIYIFGLDVVAKLDSFYAGINNAQELHLLKDSNNDDIVFCNDGKTRHANHDMNRARLRIEDIIEQHPEVEFINCSSFGAKINGAKAVDFNARNKGFDDKDDLGD